MRIGIDARLWNETGVGRYIRNLVENLLEIDSKNEYVLFVDSKTIKDLKFTSQKVKLVETNIRWHSVEEQLQFPKLLEKENLDLVHFPYFSVPILYKKPFVITIHDLIINHYPTGKASTRTSAEYYFKWLGYKFVIKKAAQKAQKIIAVSEATKNEIVKHLGVSEEKVAVTYEGIEKSSKFKMRSEKFEFKNQKYFLYVGNAYPHKNLDRLVEAFESVVADFPDVKLVFVGKEDYFYRRLKKKVTDLGIEKNVMFVGFVSEEELIFYYKNAQATILPSLMEGFGLTGLEAMQQGSLVIASDIPSLKEIYSDAAIYFDPLAPASLSATIREVLAKKRTYDSYIEKGAIRTALFSWERMAEQTLTLYESCLGVRSDK